jgi:hypothetical protein
LSLLNVLVVPLLLKLATASLCRPAPALILLPFPTDLLTFSSDFGYDDEATNNSVGYGDEQDKDKNDGGIDDLDDGY